MGWTFNVQPLFVSRSLRMLLDAEGGLPAAPADIQLPEDPFCLNSPWHDTTRHSWRAFCFRRGGRKGRCDLCIDQLQPKIPFMQDGSKEPNMSQG